MSKNVILTMWIVLISLLAGVIAILYPFGRDQGIYATVASTILDGGIPYKDSWDFKPPLIFYVYALAIKIFGINMVGIRIFDILWQSATTIIIGFIALRVFGDRLIGFFTGAFYLIFYYSYNYWDTAQSDGFLSLPLAVSILFFLYAYDKKSFFLWILVGLFLVVSALFKYTVLSFSMFFVLFILFQKQSTVSLKLRQFLGLCSGIIITIGLVILYFYFNDSLYEFIKTEFIQTPFYTKLSFKNRDLIMMFLGELQNLFSNPIISIGLFFSVASYTTIIGFKNFRYAHLLCILWLIVALISIYAQGKFFGYHHLPLGCPLALGSGFIVYFIFQSLRKFFTTIDSSKSSQRIVLITTILIICGIGCSLLNNRIYFYDSLVYTAGNGFDLDSYYKRSNHGYYGSGDFSLEADLKVIDYVKENTSVNDKIYIWGFEPLVYFLSERKCSSRFIYNAPLHWDWADEEYKLEFIESLHSNPPRLFLILEEDSLPHVNGHRLDSLQAFKENELMRYYVEKNYTYQTKIEHFYIYKYSF